MGLPHVRRIPESIIKQDTSISFEHVIPQKIQNSMPKRTGNVENQCVEETSSNHPGCTLVGIDLWGFGAGVTSKWLRSGVIKHG
jgi:hypothetical protein